MLTKEDIILRKIIKDSADDRYNYTSYDLTIDSFIDSDGKISDQSGYELKPQEIIWVVSTEFIRMPFDVTGHVFIVTNLCNNGLLALNTGIVDPGWHGPISTAIINFSNQTYYLRRGEGFLRLSFHEHARLSDIQVSLNYKTDYIEEKKKLAIEKFGRKFLSIEDITKEVSQKVVGGFKEKIAFWIIIFTFAFGFLSVFVSVISYAVPSIFGVGGGQYEKLERRIQDLENGKYLLNKIEGNKDG